jgi:hypothetical protein
MSRQDTDDVLATILDGVSASDGAFDVTVFAGGLAISGTAVSEETFFYRIGLMQAGEGAKRQRIETQKALDTRDEELAQAPSGILEARGVMETRESLVARRADLARKFIVMVDVTILGAGPAALKAPAWRGRLSQISGWVPGLVGTP